MVGDVFARGPADAADPLVRRPRLIATPRVAWYTETMFRRSAEVFAASLRRYESGPLPLWTVNEPAFRR